MKPSFHWSFNSFFIISQILAGAINSTENFSKLKKIQSVKLLHSDPGAVHQKPLAYLANLSLKTWSERKARRIFIEKYSVSAILRHIMLAPTINCDNQSQNEGGKMHRMTS